MSHHFVNEFLKFHYLKGLSRSTVNDRGILLELPEIYHTDFWYHLEQTPS